MNDNTMRSEYVALSAERSTQILSVKNQALVLYRYLSDLGASRELSLAKTKIEEAVMWATKHLLSGQ